MKCPMCGSIAVCAYTAGEHMYNPQTGKWDLARAGDVLLGDRVECECGWEGKVSQLEKS